MTRHQYKICQSIRRSGDVKKLLRTYSIPDAMELQYELDYRWLEFNGDMSEVKLSIPGQQAFEDYERIDGTVRRSKAAIVISIVSIGIAALSLVLQWIK